MSMTPFLRQKLLNFFTVFYDINRDGVIEWCDFTLAIEKICKVNGWDGSHAKKVNADKTLKMIWDGLRQYADDDKDEKVTKEEWFKMWSEVISAKSAKAEFPPWLKQYMEFMFDVTDTSGDNIVDEGEYVAAYTVYGLSENTCKKAYNTFSDNGKIALTKEEFAKLWHDYFLSEDEASKGNSLFPAPE